ncbi:MAG: PhoPQ-activated pathogenicity-related family protein [Planctomycetales bacterium]|nr:PhoPQ-activated pathogenicity-related family protein [Planctomycetales bacterium]
MRWTSFHWTLLIGTAFCAPAGLKAEETALDRYVRQPDPTFSWKIVRTLTGNGVTQFIVDMKSQTWRTEKDVNRTVWQHWVSIVKPDKATSKTAFLFISGGGNGGEPPPSADERTLQIAAATNSITVEIRMIPNQSLVFHRDGRERKEDDLIGYTWDQFLKTGDETWPARLPMVKSAVRAMDCVQELLAGDQGGRFTVEKFVVAGGSKRGWTTWCTAAVDPRVVAAVPIVIDVLNVDVSMRHHVAAYGFYAESIGDYIEHKIMRRLNDPRMKLLNAIEDPYSYRDRLTMPKFLINATGDEFFCPDSSQFYFDDLKGEKYLRYVPNASHSLRDTDALQSMTAFYETILAGTPRPKFSWTFEQDGSIRVKSQSAARQVNLWQATNPKSRDFRLATVGKAFTNHPLTDQGDGTYVGRIQSPDSGWTAFFVELVFDVDARFPLKLTTAVRVLPDTLPFADIDPEKAPLEK